MTTEHPLWLSYEQDLTQLLVDLDPGERAEVLAGVREHLHASLAGRPHPDTQDIQAVLTELGPPEEVAQEAYANQRPQASMATPRPAPTLARPWVPVLVTLLQLLGLLLVMVTTLAYTAYSVVESISPTGEVTTTVNYTSAALSVMAIALLTVLPLWIPVFVLAGLSALWDRRQKLTHILLLPTAVMLLALTPDLGWALAGERGLNTAAWISTAVVLVGSGWILWQLTSQGRARSRELSGSL